MVWVAFFPIFLIFFISMLLLVTVASLLFEWEKKLKKVLK